MSEMQDDSRPKKRPVPKTAFKPGQSGNPAGRPKDQEYRDALAMLKAKSPELMAKAIEMALNGSEKLLCAILNKICPEKIEINDGKRIVFEIVRERKRQATDGHDSSG